jgi:hypothetical protein
MLKEKKIERKQYSKNHPLNKSIKVLMNSQFGKSNDKFSFLKDSFYTLKTTINGELLISKLIENVCENTNSRILQCNTEKLVF